MGAYYPSAGASPLTANQVAPSMAQMAQAAQKIGATAASTPSIHNLNMGMSLEETTLANLFQNRGYRTSAVGKWHLGDTAEYLPTARGFDSYFGVPYSDDMAPLPLIRNTTAIEAETDRDLLTPKYTEEAVSFINQFSSKPFFLYLAYSYPHDPARASARFRGKSGLGIYGDAVMEIDWSVGEILNALERMGTLNDTLLMFTSDHGPWFQGSAGELRGRKGTNYEGGHRVPFLAQWPAGIPAGMVIPAWSSNLDIVPTLTTLCGLESPPNPLDGVDLSPILRGKANKLDRKSILYFSSATTRDGSTIHCARKDNWKLRFAQAGGGEMYVSDYTAGRTDFWLARPELYNLETDPTECYDVAAEHPEIAKQIMNDVDSQLATMPDNVKKSFESAQGNVAGVSTPPGAAPRPQTNALMPSWIWIPPDRR